jgi:type VI protein secretion system component VasK
MARGGVGKRLEPKMTRGGFRFTMTMACIMVAFEVIVLALRLLGPWDSLSYWYIAIILATAGLIGWLLYVRRHDSAFWDKEEAEREEWNQRGRQL